LRTDILCAACQLLLLLLLWLLLLLLLLQQQQQLSVMEMAATQEKSDASRTCSCIQGRRLADDATDSNDSDDHLLLYGTRVAKTNRDKPRYADDGSDLVGLAAMCDWFCCERQVIRLNTRHPPRIIYLSTYAGAVGIPYFVRTVMPTLSVPFVLVLAGDDYSFPRGAGDCRAHVFRACQRECQQLLQSPLVIRLFIEEPDIVDAERISVLPIGFHVLNRQNRHLLLQQLLMLPHQHQQQHRRHIRVLNSHRAGGPRQGPQWRNRELVHQRCASEEWREFVHTPDGEMPLADFLATLRQSQFCLCVNGGGQGPSHKCWEALLSGCIPIMQRCSALADAYDGLPIAWVDDWAQPDCLTAAKLDVWNEQLSTHALVQNRSALLYRLTTCYQLNRMLCHVWIHDQQQQQHQHQLRIVSAGKGFWGRRVIDHAWHSAMSVVAVITSGDVEPLPPPQWTDLNAAVAAHHHGTLQQPHLIVKSHFIQDHTAEEIQWLLQQQQQQPAAAAAEVPTLCWSGESYLVDDASAFLHIVGSSTCATTRTRTMPAGKLRDAAADGQHHCIIVQHLPYMINACYCLLGVNVVADGVAEAIALAPEKQEAAIRLRRPYLLAYCARNPVERRDRLFRWIRQLDTTQTTHGLGWLMHTEGVAPVEGSWASAELRQRYSQYRFVMAMENEQTAGYVTEKLMNAWVSGCVPIYWGDVAMVRHLFGADADGALINVDDFATLEACARHIVDMSDADYLQLAARNPLRQCRYFQSQQQCTDTTTSGGVLCEWRQIHADQLPSTSFARLGYYILRRLCQRGGGDSIGDLY